VYRATAIVRRQNPISIPGAQSPLANRLGHRALFAEPGS
jgi:hypothetical protein